MDGSHHRPIDWGTVLALVVFIAGSVTAFIVVREAVANLSREVAAKTEVDRDQTEAINSIKQDRAMERAINELKNEVTAMGGKLDAVSDDVKDLKRRR